MRIITGVAKGRKLKCPEGMGTRPTTDRAKESVFNIIQNNIYDSDILDLFAGTGNLGLECISRGCRSCTFVEHDKIAHKFLLENIKSLDFQSKSLCYNKDAFNMIEVLGAQNKKYDIIFLDPPYSNNLVVQAIKKINKFNLLNEDGIIVSEYDDQDPVPEKIEDFEIYRNKKYGRVMISFWSKEDIDE